LAEALAFVHEQGICHGDLKPSNVLLTPAGRPMLLDFNLAFDSQRQQQRLGGTLPYMAPEQLRVEGGGWSTLHPAPSIRHPQPTTLDPRSDLFALGVIIYEVLAGAHPFGPFSLKQPAEAIADQLRKRHRDGPPSLRLAIPQVEPAVAEVVERCLAY